MIDREGVKEVAISTLGKILKEPLLHFVAAGFVLFMAYSTVQSTSEFEVDDQIINVDRAALLTFLQFRSRAFDPEAAEHVLDTLPDEARNALIEEYIREEALFRDALALDLGEGDDIIRRRMVQKAEFLAQGFVELGLEVNDDMARTYFSENRNLYREPALITFTHVFFDAESRGEEAAAEAADATIDVLNSGNVPFSEAIAYGDRFPFHLNYVDRGMEEVRVHFGDDMTQHLFELTPSESTWAGPFQSPYGMHLAMVTQIQAARDLEFTEVHERVLSDVREVEMQRRTEEAIGAIIAAYEVRIDLPTGREEGQ